MVGCTTVPCRVEIGETFNITSKFYAGNLEAIFAKNVKSDVRLMQEGPSVVRDKKSFTQFPNSSQVYGNVFTFTQYLASENGNTVQQTVAVLDTKTEFNRFYT